MGDFARRVALIVGLAAVLPGCGVAQAFDVSAGSSTMYNSTGATLSIHQENNDWTFGGGVQQGRFAAGGFMQQRTQRGLLVVGVQETHADLPTDIFDDPHRLVGVGAGFTRVSPDRRGNLSLFAGMSSTDGGSPLFRSGDLERPQMVAGWSHPFLAQCRLVSLAVYLDRLSGTQSMECARADNKAAAAASLGIGSAGLYGAGSLRYAGHRFDVKGAYFKADADQNRNTSAYGPMPEPDRVNLAVNYRLSRAWAFSAAHQNFLIGPDTDRTKPELSTPRERTALDQIGLSYSSHSRAFSVTALSSALQENASGADAAQFAANVSLSGSFGQTFGPVRWTEALFSSMPAGLSWQTMVVNGLEVRLTPHLLISEAIDVANSTATFAHGGEFVTGNAALRVNYELVYLANRPQNPFQQLMLLSAELHLWHVIALECSTEVDPMGKPLYTFRFSTAGAHLPASSSGSVEVNVGKSVLTGLIVDEEGTPVAGAALSIGSSYVYSDSHGWFTFRENRIATHSLRVLTDEFLFPGRFEVKSAPQLVVSAREPGAAPVRIVVRRVRPEEANAAALRTPEVGSP